MTYQIVILAAGKGTRMGGNIPKVLISLQNRPLILYLAETLQKVTQLVKPVAVVGYEADKVKAILGDDFVYAYQSEQLGTAHAVMSAKVKVKANNILVLYGDMPFITAESLKRLVKLHRHSQANISMLTALAPSFDGIYKSLEGYGRIVRAADKSVQKIVEFKDATMAEREILEVNPGIYMFNAKWLWQNLEKIKNHNKQNEYYLTDIVEVAITAGEKIASQSVEAREVLGVNTPQDLKVAEELLGETVV